VSANEEKKAGGYALQSDRLREHQDERGYCVLDSVVIKHRFEPVTQKMKNEVKVERDKDAVDDQLDDKIRKGTFSGIFHTVVIGISPGLPLCSPGYKCSWKNFAVRFSTCCRKAGSSTI
jgi:hypothetical protein